MNDDLHTDASRGARAERLLSDELLQEAFSELTEAYTEAWRDTNYKDTDGRERLWQALQIVRKVKSHLEAVVNSGKVAQRELDEIQRLGERKKLFGVV